jgi:hypothetical protein
MARLLVARTLFLLSAWSLAACTSGASTPGDASTTTPGDDGATGEPGGDGDGATGETDGGPSEDDGGATGEDDAQVACKTACAPGDCEQVPDNCGGFLTCDACAPGEVCGLREPNKCGVPPSSCTPLVESETCAGKCGSVSNGCDGVYQCSSDNGGVSCTSEQVCGGYADKLSPNTCVDKPSCTPTSCAALGLACGVAGDGCGGTLDCTALLGGCGAGKQCGTGTEYGTCVDIPATCQPKTAAEACAGTCGVVSDGCDDSINCAAEGFACPNGTTCGGGGESGKCGSGPTCQPIVEATACAGICGDVSDGCSGVYNCSAANGGLTCSASSECIAGQCVTTNACTPRSASEACPVVGGHKSCGIQNDLCGGTIDCGGCAADEGCGLGGPSLCGSKTPVCTPVSEATACARKCGTVADGCGGTYTCSSANGGVSCTGNEYCGANAANTCGAPPVTCTPKTCADFGHTCGLASDGCGRVLNCWPSCSPNSATCTGTCPDTGACLTNATTRAQQCVAGTPSCVGSLCGAVPTSCSQASPTKLTGTVRTPGVGGLNQLPVPNALVYIPADGNATLPEIYEGVSANDSASCGRCADEKLVADGQSVLASAVTDYKGEFTLSGRIPVGSAFKLVVKVGKWRRVVQVPSTVASACNSRALDLTYTRLSASSTDGLAGTHLPKIAVSTGAVDAMECVFRNLGVAETEFTSPRGSGRLHLYRAAPQFNSDGSISNGGGALPTSGVTCDGSYVNSRGRTVQCSSDSNAGCYNGRAECTFSNADTRLHGSNFGMLGYDLVVYDCEGYAHNHASGDNAHIIDYVDHGGRMFASHYAYTFIENNGSLDGSADWGVSTSATSDTGFISLPSGSTQRAGANAVKSVLFRNWLSWQGALDGTTADQLVLPATPQFSIAEPRDRAGANVGPSTDEWVYRNNSGAKVQQLSFNTPYGAAEAQVCGRVAYSGFHVSGASAGGSGKFFPDICGSARALSTQEKILAFMLFDLATCVSNGDPPTPPQCTPANVASTCPGENDACGFVNDGCGGVVDCAGCASGFYCDGNTCRPQECTPETCASLGFTCGNHADGCGGVARNSQGQQGCGTCTNGQVCGFNSPGVCGGCVQIPQATACAGKNCGSVSDGCGGVYDCGTCPSGQVCGAAGANLCGPGTCTKIPQATACANKNCGAVSDGCGGSYSCGTCSAPESCGGGGVPNVCGQPTCTPLAKANACANKQCGWVSDGCGGAIQCGTCPNGGVCGGAGPNQCGSTCTPTTCTAQGAECGAVADRCGALLDCGQCPSGQTCGAGGPNKCGSGPSCTPLSCAQAGASCGLTGDGCGGVLDCGTCTSPATCGGQGAANQCGVGTGGCTPISSCSAQGVECGQASDGCGGLIQCDPCPSGYMCQLGKCELVLR